MRGSAHIPLVHKSSAITYFWQFQNQTKISYFTQPIKTNKNVCWFNIHVNHITIMKMFQTLGKQNNKKIMMKQQQSGIIAIIINYYHYYKLQCSSADVLLQFQRQNKKKKWHYLLYMHTHKNKTSLSTSYKQNCCMALIKRAGPHKKKSRPNKQAATLLIHVCQSNSWLPGACTNWKCLEHQS